MWYTYSPVPFKGLKSVPDIVIFVDNSPHFPFINYFPFLHGSLHFQGQTFRTKLAVLCSEQNRVRQFGAAQQTFAWYL